MADETLRRVLVERLFKDFSLDFLIEGLGWIPFIFLLLSELLVKLISETKGTKEIFYLNYQELLFHFVLTCFASYHILFPIL